MKKFFTLLLVLLCANESFSQVSVTTLNTDYTQNFDGLGSSGNTWADNTTLQGWYAKTDGTGSSITAYSVSNGSGTTPSAALYSLGTTSASDRAIGYFASNAFTGNPGKGYVGFRLKNNTGVSILSITITYTGEQWRKENNATTQSLTVDYQTGTTVTNLTAGTWTSTSTSLNFVSPIVGATTAAALDGNNSLNRVANISLSFNLASALANGDEIMIRWADPNDSGTDHMLAIDDVAVSTSSTTLPIKLLSFQAKKLQNTVQLTWSTASEINNSHFNVERSVDGKEFTSITRIKGAGNSNRILNYSATDEKPFNGTNYYRLRQTDFDGTSTVSNIVAVNSDKKNFEILHAQSADHSLNMGIYSPNASSTTIAIIDLSGRLIAEENINLTEGFNTISISTKNIVTGIHLIRVSGAENTVSKKFVF